MYRPQLQANEENYKLCLQFAWSHIKHHRHLSINLHEVKRDIEGICEKFKLNNFHDEEKEFHKICETTLAHELGVYHYERDVIYSIISMLTALAYDPIGKLKDKKRNGLPVFMRIKKFEEKSNEHQKFIDSLLQDNFTLTRNIDSESELSEWSDDDEVNKSTSESETEEQSVRESNAMACTLQPPRKIDVFTKHSIKCSENDMFLTENGQTSWWNTNQVTLHKVKSNSQAANFCLDWEKHISKRSMGFIKPQPISIVLERCLLREILWMFSSAVECKFFVMENNHIYLRSNVSLSSTSPSSLAIFLRETVSHINIMRNLKTEIENAFANVALSHTLENYYESLAMFVHDIMEFVLQQETLIREGKLYTIIQFQNVFRPHGKMLVMLWDIHKSSVQIEGASEPHIRALHLIASLNAHVYKGETRIKRNLAMTLLLTCLKTYMRIFDLWWTDARLQDLKKEFLMEKVTRNDCETFHPRLIQKCKERAFYIKDSASSLILNDNIITLMMYFANEASVTLKIIGKLDRTHEVKQIKSQTHSLYDEFMEKVLKTIQEFASNDVVEIKKVLQDKSDATNNERIVEEMRNDMIADNDELMLLVFNSTFDCLIAPEGGEKNASTMSLPLNIYKMLEKSTESIFLPLENQIFAIIKELLAKKISIAEKFVLDIYLNEFSLKLRFQEVRRVFLLESHELMNFFNKKLFPQMESGDSNWANPYLLTTALNEALCSERPFSTYFGVHVNKKMGHLSVLAAIDEIEIQHCTDDIFESIFPADTKAKYNESRYIATRI
jgi:hypothetical protein